MLGDLEKLGRTGKEIGVGGVWASSMICGFNFMNLWCAPKFLPGGWKGCLPTTNAFFKGQGTSLGHHI